MDPTSAVRTEAIPVVATVIAPGAFASSSYAWAILSKAPELRAFLDHHEAIAVSAAVLVWIVAGLVMESAGSYVEVYGIDRLREDRDKHLDEWWRYLRIAWSKDKEPIGQRYLRRLLVSFKFELNMCVAAAFSIPGVVWLYWIDRLDGRSAGVAVAVLVAVSGLTYAAARDSAGVLARTRSELLRGVGEPPNV